MKIPKGTVIQVDRTVAGKSLGCPGLIGRLEQAMQGSLALAMVNSLDLNPHASGSYWGLGDGSVVSRKGRLLLLVTTD